MDLNFKIIATYLVTVFALLMLFFYKSGLWRVITLFIGFILVLVIPGMIIFYVFTTRINRSTLLLSPLIGFGFISLFAYFSGMILGNFRPGMYGFLGICYAVILYYCFKHRSEISKKLQGLQSTVE